ncbi:MAG: glycosyltransferase [Lachnospiraceae bacterium]|nr:glycosyltransferase [Lachnospiraceae bacterium]
MKEKKLVSIVVPVYNAETFLNRCVDSLIAQTWENIEIILVDDGSTDASGGIIDAYARMDGRVKALHKRNGGVSSARNMGIDHAEGEYIIFADSDDCLHRELIEIYMLALEKDEIIICGNEGDTFQTDCSYLSKWEEQRKYYTQRDLMKLFCENYLNPIWNKLYLRSRIVGNGIRFDEGKNLGEDLLFNLKYFLCSPPMYQLISCPLYYYQEREGSLDHSWHAELFQVQQETFAELRKVLEGLGCWDQESQKLYYALYWDRMYLSVRIYQQYRKTGQKPEAGRQLKQALSSETWKIVESSCRSLGVMDLKRVLKKMHLQILNLTV